MCVSWVTDKHICTGLSELTRSGLSLCLVTLYYDDDGDARFDGIHQTSAHQIHRPTRQSLEYSNHQQAKEQPTPW